MEGDVKLGITPPGALILTEMASPDLNQLLRETNVNSLNVMADNLLLVLGREASGEPGTREKGLKAVYDFFDELGLAKDEAVIADGSGLDERIE